MRHWAAAALLIAVEMQHSGQTLAPRSADVMRFEVVSIKKRLQPLRPPVTNVISGSLFRMPSVTVATLVQSAWQIRDFQLVGGEKWMRTDYFEVDARAGNDVPTPEQVRLMVRSMLADRFGLAVHSERRDLPYYALELARNDGRLGPDLKRWPDCTKRVIEPRPTWATGTSGTGCGRLGDVATNVTYWLDRPVIDATGLGGTFDFAWHIPSDPSLDREIWASSGRQPLSRVNQAMEEHLGLTLKARQGPFDLLVVDSLQQPIEN